MSTVRHFARSATAAMVVAVAPFAQPGLAGPVLTIVPSTNPPIQEVQGDNGGTIYGLANPIGQGIPTVSGSWPMSPSMGVEPVTGGTGATGYHGANLTLSETARVTFQFSGKGDANYYNTFQVLVSGSWTELFTSRTAGPPFTPAFTFVMAPGTLPFRFTTTSANDNIPNPPLPPATIITNGSNTTDITQAASFFLGVDPYTTALQYATTGTAVYAGFSDRPEAMIGDHDHQDLVVRITAAIVPEPGAALLTVAGGGAWLAASLAHRRSRRSTRRTAGGPRLSGRRSARP